MRKNKIGVSYNLFDGEELLEGSIKCIRNNVNYISVIYQTTSNHGELCDGDLINTLFKLKNNGLIDEIELFKPDLTLSPTVNELRKRNLGIELSLKNECNYHMSMDSDEYYVIDEFKNMCKILIDIDYDVCLYQMVTYYKDFNHRLEPKETYYVPGLHKINSNTIYDVNYPSPVLVDPTRKVNGLKFKILEREDIEMHHMSYVRKDLNKKLNNSSANSNFNNINEVVKYYNNWEYPQKGLICGINNWYSELIKVKNLFN